MNGYLFAAAAHGIPTLVWAILAIHLTRVLARARPRARTGLFILLTLVAWTNTIHFLGHTVVALTPTELDGHAAGLHAAVEAMVQASVVWTIAFLVHLIQFLPVPPMPPSRRWLAVNYGVATLVSGAAIVAALHVGPLAVRPWLIPDSIVLPYTIVAGGVGVWNLARLARRGLWRPGAYDVRGADVAIFAIMVPIAVWILTQAGGALPSAMSSGMLVLHTVLALGLAVPFAVRMLGELVRGFLLTSAMIAAATLTLAAYVRATRGAGDELRALLGVLAVLTLVVVVGLAQFWLRPVIDRVVFRRSHRRRAELQAAAEALSPEHGLQESCRAALAALVRIMPLPGAGIVLVDGSTVSQGPMQLDALARVWASTPASPSAPGFAWTRELPPALAKAAFEAEVAWVMPLASPRRHWGHLVAGSGFLAGPLTPEDVDAVAAFAGQLARVLDGVELLERAVAVERSLAHAEKLAAIGEVTARIAHDIRNPVTAARSLAQQLAREATPFASELGLVLGELERVERQVAELLRFARRDEVRAERVDLTEVVRATMATFRARCEAAGVHVELDLADRTLAHVDRERVRQVVVNLVENALDALGGTTDGRRLAVSLNGDERTVCLRVADNGPGVAADALPHLFEPFFSLKPHGTGLGLAIAKRTVEAHGGRIAARPGDDAGLTVILELPREEA